MKSEITTETIFGMVTSRVTVMTHILLKNLKGRMSHKVEVVCGGYKKLDNKGKVSMNLGQL